MKWILPYGHEYTLNDLLTYDRLGEIVLDHPILNLILLIQFVSLCVFIWAIITKKYNDSPKLFITGDDMLENAHRMRKFLKKRSRFGLRFFCKWASDDGDKYYLDRLGDVLDWENVEVVKFLRVCNSLGCQVIIRQIGTDDSEEIKEQYVTTLQKKEEEY